MTGYHTALNVARKAIDKRWNRNTISLVSSVTAVMRLPISWISSMADWFQMPAVSTATDKKMWEAESEPYFTILFAAVLFATEHASLAVWSLCEYYYSAVSIAPRLHDAANRYINSYALNKKIFSLFLNMTSDMSGVRGSVGRLFHTQCPWTANQRSSIILTKKSESETRRKGIWKKSWHILTTEHSIQGYRITFPV